MTCERTARLAGIAVASAAVAWAAAAPSLGSAAAAKLHGNNFFSNCRFSHKAADDPIVYPGQAGRSHLHTFFGNTSTSASSTLTSLRRAQTTCRPGADKAAYWVPALYQNGREIRPAKAQLYYVVRGYTDMHPFPAGLRMIAGNAHAVRPQSARVTYWTCGGQAARTEPSAAPPPVCGVIGGQGLGARRRSGKPAVVRWRTKTFLELHVTFPDCWDGKHLDAPDHRSHMAYSRGYVCPHSHPVKVPLIRLAIRYPIDRGAGVWLSSGGVYSGHADFFNAWNQPALRRLVNACFHTRPCNEPRATRHAQR